MTIILFLVDTSASMCQKAYVNGVQKTYLDIAKGAVETFLKYRQRTQDCLGDRYMLLTFEEPPANVKAGWKENHATFMNELKNLQSNGLTSMGESLRNAFDLLNLNRMQSGIDTYGQGRCPFYLEPSVIIVITDGGRYSYRNGVHQEIILPLSTQVPGTKFTKEPFRWDQRLFSLVLRMSGNKMDERVEGKVPHDDSPIERMCEVTGGRSYRVRSHYVLNQCIESLVQKVQAGVVLQFEPLPPKEQNESQQQQPDIVFQPTKKMIYVQKHISQKTFPIGYWPLPEPYWPDPKAVTLPPRDAHPKLKIITTAVEEPQLVRSFPVDKYEIEACPLTLQILNKREMNKCWQVIVTNGMHGFELPFGYLKAAPNFTQVHLYVLAYNYSALLPLLHDLIHKYNMNPPNDLMYKFNAYVRSIPPYYCPFLRKALVNVNVPYQLLQFLLPDNVDNYLSPTVANQLKHIKNTAKQDQENLCLKVYKQLKQTKPPYRQVETAKLNTGALLRRDLVRNPLLRDTFIKLHAEIDPVENYTIVVPQLTRPSSAKSYRNPFDVPRRDMIEEIARMREAFLRLAPTSLVAKDSGHCLPISEMGNYQEYLKNKDNPLREIEPTNVRQHMFGNPYKKDKHMVMVDEADLSDVAPMKAAGNGGGGGGGVPGGTAGGGVVSSVQLGGSKKLDAPRSRKRKAGPLPRNFEFRRLSIDVRPSTSSSASSTPSRSSYDEDTSSETSSICSDDTSDDSDLDRIGIGFDFNEEETSEQDTALNGYVHNFINGISDESSMDSDSGTSTNGASVGSSNNSNTNANATTTALPLAVATTPAASSTVVMPAAATAASATASTIISAAAAVTAAAPNTSIHETGASLGATASTHYSAVNGMTHATYGYAPHATTAITAEIPATANLSKIVGAGICNGFFNHVTALSNHHATASPSTPHALGVTGNLASTSSSAAAAAAGVAAGASLNSTIAAAAATSSSTTASSVLSGPSASHSPYYNHNDINDTIQISRILQQCHTANGSGASGVASSLSITSCSMNGGGSNSNSNNHTNNNNNNNNNSDTKLDATNATTSSGVSVISSSNNFDSLKRESNNGNSCSGSGGSCASNKNSTTSSSSNSHLPHPHPHWGSTSLTSNHNSGANTNTNTNHQHLNNINHANHINNNNSNNNNNNNYHPANHNNQTQQQQQQLPNKSNDAADLMPLFTDEQREAARKHNLDLRLQIFRDIRRPGRDYSELLERLNLIKGDHDMISDFVDMCIRESQRFRRRQMVSSIQDWWTQKQDQQQQQQTQTHMLPPSSPLFEQQSQQWMEANNKS